MVQQICYCLVHFCDWVAEFRYQRAICGGRVTGQIHDWSMAAYNHPPRDGEGEHYGGLWDVQFQTRWSQTVSEYKILQQGEF